MKLLPTLLLSAIILSAPSQYQIKKMAPDFIFSLDGDAKEWDESYFIDSLHSEDNIRQRSDSSSPWTPSWFQYKLYLNHTDSSNGWICGAVKVVRDTNYIVRTTGWAGSGDNMKFQLGGQAQAFYIPSDGAAPTTNPSCPFQTNVNMFARCKTYGNFADSLPTYEFKFKKEVVLPIPDQPSFTFIFGTEEISIINGKQIGFWGGVGVEYTGYKHCWTCAPWDESAYSPTFTLIQAQGNFSEVHSTNQSTQLTISAYPNPFLPVTNINYTADKSGIIKIFDSFGRLVKSENINGGSGKASFNGAKLPSGVYIAQLESNRNITTTKLFLTR
ncbi:MAG: T9SS type A sorting domain-containing protein [Fibrobacteres bacterium]|nr:T9SS type A sorting domain-containing protein [Fibrobacterota bacterium]